MTDQLPTVDIKGKEYVLVKDRVLYFNEKHQNGMIQTDLTRYENGQVVIVAKVWPDAAKPDRFYTGWSQARENDGYINKTSALENAETSAVGRALAMMGIGVIESIASADELVKATTQHNTYGDEEKQWDNRVGISDHLQTTAAKIIAENRNETYPDVSDTEHVCAVHHKQMKERVNTHTNGKFYDHRTKNEAGEWLMCNGSGEWKSSSF